jgi:hypothetical protein
MQVIEFVKDGAPYGDAVRVQTARGWALVCAHWFGCCAEAGGRATPAQRRRGLSEEALMAEATMAPYGVWYASTNYDRVFDAVRLDSPVSE